MQFFSKLFFPSFVCLHSTIEGSKARPARKVWNFRTAVPIQRLKRPPCFPFPANKRVRRFVSQAEMKPTRQRHGKKKGITQRYTKKERKTEREINRRRRFLHIDRYTLERVADTDTLPRHTSSRQMTRQRLSAHNPSISIYIPIYPQQVET